MNSLLKAKPDELESHRISHTNISSAVYNYYSTDVPKTPNRFSLTLPLPLPAQAS